MKPSQMSTIGILLLSNMNGELDSVQPRIIAVETQPVADSHLMHATLQQRNEMSHSSICCSADSYALLLVLVALSKGITKHATDAPA